jgi:hypothetical protein
MKRQHTPSVVVNETQLAEHWGVTTRRVRQLQTDGIAIRAGGGFDLVASDRAFISWLRRDEDGARTRRRMTELRAEQIATKLMRQDRELLTPQEVWDFALEVMFGLRQGFTSASTLVYQSLSGREPKLGLAIQESAERTLNHLWRTMVEPAFERWKKHITDEDRLHLLDVTRRVRLRCAELDQLPEDSDPDVIPFSRREHVVADDDESAHMDRE